MFCVESLNVKQGFALRLAKSERNSTHAQLSNAMWELGSSQEQLAVAMLRCSKHALVLKSVIHNSP